MTGTVEALRGSGKVRLSGGRFGGRWIAVPATARPTEGRVREALLSAWQECLPGARLLDLFAGSGAIALEALGRGAASAVAVEDDRQAVTVLRQNVALLAAAGCTVERLSLPDGLCRPGRLRQAPFDLIFADPPYDFRAWTQLLTAAPPLLAPAGEMAIEHARGALPELAEGHPLRLDRQRHYGGSALSFFRHVPPGDAHA